MQSELDSLGLTAFLSVCATKNFTQAAALLHITQPALSQRILRFEESIGRKLIERDAKSFALTAAGHEVWLYGRRKKELVNELFENLGRVGANELQKPLKLGAFSSVLRSLIMPALFNMIRSKKNMGLHVCVREVYELPSLLSSGMIDFMILNYQFVDDLVESEHIFDEDYVLVKPKENPHVDVYLDHDPQDQTTISFLRTHGLAIHNLKRSFCDDIYGVLDGVRFGVGRAIVPRHLIHGVDGIVLEESFEGLRSPVFFHWKRSQRENKLTQDVREAIKKILDRPSSCCGPAVKPRATQYE